jgi:hypothetical protein
MTAVARWDIPLTPAGPYSGKPVGEAEMAHLLCLLFGHHKSLVPLSSNRYVCRRCGFDFGVEGPPAPASAGPPPLPPTMKRGAARRLHR